MRPLASLSAIVLGGTALCLVPPLESTAAEIREWRDMEYARIQELSLRLDLYVPSMPAQPPLIVWVHGGAWRSGSKADPPVGRLLDSGFAIASVDYRLTPVAPFPANVHDIKAAIRFLRSQAAEYGFDANRFVIAGDSAGGHLAALVGVSNGDRALEGRVGDRLEVSSDVQLIVSFYGASNLRTILSQSTPHGLGVRIPALQLLLGGQPDDKPDLARQASPVEHVNRGDPPLLLIHGDQDPQMPINQAHELQGAYAGRNLPVEFEVVHGAAHGGNAFYTRRMLDRVAQFIQSHLPGP